MKEFRLEEEEEEEEEEENAFWPMPCATTLDQKETKSVQRSCLYLQESESAREKKLHWEEKKPVIYTC